MNSDWWDLGSFRYSVRGPSLISKARKDSDRDGKKSICHSMTFIVFVSIFTDTIVFCVWHKQNKSKKMIQKTYFLGSKLSCVQFFIINFCVHFYGHNSFCVWHKQNKSKKMIQKTYFLGSKLSCVQFCVLLCPILCPIFFSMCQIVYFFFLCPVVSNFVSNFFFNVPDSIFFLFVSMCPIILKNLLQKIN